MAAIEEGEILVDGVRAFYRRVPGEGTPVVYCHGNPSHGEDWVPFMERGGPSIAIDMPGWGRSDRPDPKSFDYSMYGLSAFLERALEELGIGRRKLVVHDWGCLALIGAQRRPDLVERLVAMNIVPLTPGFRWHWVAQVWRRRPFGEFVTATGTKRSMALAMRQARGDWSPMPDQFLDRTWRYWDKGTSRAILRLYRHADPDRLVAAGRDLGRIDLPGAGHLGRPGPLSGAPIRRGHRRRPRQRPGRDPGPGRATGPGSTTRRSSTGYSNSSLNETNLHDAR